MTPGPPPACLSPMDALAEIKRLYFSATRDTIQRDFAAAIDLLKTLESDDERERASVYMQGLAEMRREWGGAAGGRKRGARRPKP